MIVQCAIVPLIQERIRNEIVIEDRQKHAIQKGIAQGDSVIKESASRKSSVTGYHTATIRSTVTDGTSLNAVPTHRESHRQSHRTSCSISRDPSLNIPTADNYLRRATGNMAVSYFCLTLRSNSQA